MERFRTGTEEIRLRGIAFPDPPQQRFLKCTGVVVIRQISSEGSLSIRLFLKKLGLLWARLPGAGRGTFRFGGVTEPLVWGTYQLYQSPKGIYMKEAEVQEDFWSLRSRPSAMIMALRWARWLDRFLIEKYPYDDLLALFYWALRALQKGVGTEAIQARFLWKWLQSWGSAPDLVHCVSCGAPLEGRGFFIGDGLLCRDCSGDGGIPLVLDKIAPYVMAPRFLQVSDFESQELRSQSKNLSNCLLKSLESYR